jgi:heptosyltransferase III
VSSLVYHAGALGDFITALPAIGAWRALHPHERVILLGRPVHAPLAQPPFDEVWDAASAGVAALFGPSAGAAPRLRTLLAPVSSALLFASSASALPAALKDLGAREIVRQDPFPSSPVPVVDYHLSLFPGRAFTAEERVPRVSVDADPSARAVVALHPGSGGARKNWPLERFTEVSLRLAREGRSVAWVLGAAEEDVSPPRGIQEWRCLPLLRLAGLLSRCRLFIGNDSGIAHLAAASGCPVIALFGGSDPRIWAPRGPRVRVIVSGSDGMQGIGVDDVVGAGLETLDLE